MKLSKILIKTSVTCDYIPVVSTVTNLVELFLKLVFIVTPNSVKNSNNYFRYISKKSALTCIFLTIPLLSNLFVCLNKKNRPLTDSELPLLLHYRIRSDSPINPDDLRFDD